MTLFIFLALLEAYLAPPPPLKYEAQTFIFVLGSIVVEFSLARAAEPLLEPFSDYLLLGGKVDYYYFFSVPKFFATASGGRSILLSYH